MTNLTISLVVLTIVLILLEVYGRVQFDRFIKTQNNNI